MRSLGSQLAALALVLVASGSMPARSFAQDAPVEDGAPGGEARARALFRDGVAAAEAGRWEEARSRFEETYALLPRPQVLLNLAGARAQTGRLTAAASAYREIAESAAAIPDELRAAARDALATLEPRIPRLSLSIEGDLESDEVRLDETVLAPAERDVERGIDPGRHAVVIERGGSQLLREDFRLYDGERLRLDLRVPDRAPVALERAALEVVVPDREEWFESPIFWTVVGVVVAGVVAIAIAVSIQPESPFVGNLPPGMISVR